MICEVCKKKEALIHLQEHSLNGVRTVRLCLECAAVKGLNIRSQDVESLFTNFVSNLFNGENNNKSINIPSLKLLNLHCPTCGTPLNSIIEDNLAGCQYCFSEFGKVIDSIIFSNNNSIEYKGSLPEDIDRDRNYKKTIFKLKRQLRENIEKNDFKEAVIVRDKIKSLKKSQGHIRNEQNR